MTVFLCEVNLFLVLLTMCAGASLAGNHHTISGQTVQLSSDVPLPYQLRAEDFEINGFDCGISGSPKLIVNGSAATEGQFPWMVHLKIYPAAGVNPSRCGGTIITRRHVLTAAHCVVLGEKRAFAIDVLYGNNDVNKATEVSVEKMMPHPHYDALLSLNDIGILLVVEPFRYSKDAGPVCLPPRKMDVLGKLVLASGWGFTVPGGPWADYLQYTTLTVIPDRVCLKKHMRPYRKDIVLCAEQNNTSVCHGDSGGPISIKIENDRFVQVGITSHGFDACPSYGVVFTRVDTFMPWIKTYIGKHSAYSALEVRDIPFTSYAFSSKDTPYESPHELFAC